MKKLYFYTLTIFSFAKLTAQSAPIVQVQINPPISICSVGDCTDLYAQYYHPKITNGYTVSAINYSPPFAFTGWPTIDAFGNDVWSPTINLPFSFCFYGTSYNQLIVGSNGVITFDLISNIPGGFCPHSFSNTIPSLSFPIRNAIYGVYQDTNIASPPITNPSLQNVNYVLLDTGINAAPNRVFMVNFTDLPQYQCNASNGLQTSQIVMYEGTNIIDVYIKNRNSCATWNSGNGVIGIQNQDGTQASAAPGRNTGSWNATNEAWRFTPNGADVPSQITWFADGVPAGSDNPLQVCPTAEHVYTATVSYDNCGAPMSVSRNYTESIINAPMPLSNPADISVCDDGSITYMADIDINTSLVLNAVNPTDYEVYYYEDMSDAENQASNYITDLHNYPFSTNQTIYMRVENVYTLCYKVFSFQLIIVPPVAAPIGEATQNFTNGQTLADLVITGQNIVWYDAPTGGNQLSSATLLQNGITYYAAQIQNGCESRNINSSRLSVTVNLVLASEAFSNNMFSVYPNPANSLLNISFASNLKSIEIYNAVGQKVFEQYPDKKEVALDISRLAVGIYFVKIDSATKHQTVKVIKE